MAILAVSGFDACSPTQAGDDYWNANTGSPSRSTSQFRTGTGSADVGAGSIGKIFTSNPTTIIVAHAHRLTALNVTMLELMEGASNRHISITVDSDGTLRARRGTGSGTILGSSSAGLIPTNAWFHLEVKAVIHDTTGSVEVRFNGATVINVTSVDTANSANVFVERVLFSSGFVDDVVILDTTGAQNNTFIGDCKVETIFPNAAGTTTQWTPSAGSNFQNVDDPTPDDDTTYNENAVVNELDLYNLDTLATTSGSVKAVQILGRMKKTDAGTREAAIINKSGATTTVGTTRTLGTSYVTYRELYELNPDDSAAWAISDVNALEAGVKTIT